MNDFDEDDMADLPVSFDMLEEELYWQIVAESLANSKDEKEQETYLIARLEKMPLQEIIGFRFRTDKLLYDTHTSPMWCAAHLINSGCSDDGFIYFRNWVISRGKEVYTNAKENPDTLITQIHESCDYYEFESFWYVALEAYENRTGQDLYEHIELGEFEYSEFYYPGIGFNWTSKNPESMKAICPRLFDKMKN